MVAATNANNGPLSDRYETGSKRSTNNRSRQLRDLIEEGRSKADDIETRSLHTELDYSKKDAVRHIVKGGAAVGAQQD